MPSNRAIVSAASKLLGMRFNRFNCQVTKLQLSLKKRLSKSCHLAERLNMLLDCHHLSNYRRMHQYIQKVSNY